MQVDLEKQTAPVAVIVRVFLQKSQVPNEILKGSYCPRPLQRRRHELMWLLQRLTHLGLTQIGAVVGGLDLTTVRAGIVAVSDRMATDQGLRKWLLETEADCLAESGSQLIKARQAVVADDSGSKELSMAVTILCVASVLASQQLSDAEARHAALQLINREKEVQP